MENFFLGTQAILQGLSFFIKSVSRYPLFWGFGFGFLISTLVHGFLITNSPRSLPTILFKDKAIGFEKIRADSRTKDGTYTSSFSAFIQTANLIRFFFTLSFFLFTLIILISILRF